MTAFNLQLVVGTHGWIIITASVVSLFERRVNMWMLSTNLATSTMCSPMLVGEFHFMPLPQMAFLSKLLTLHLEGTLRRQTFLVLQETYVALEVGVILVKPFKHLEAAPCVFSC